MILKDILNLVANCKTNINLVDINGRTIWYKQKREFNETYNECDVLYIDAYKDNIINDVSLEIGINFEVY